MALLRGTVVRAHVGHPVLGELERSWFADAEGCWRGHVHFAGQFGGVRVPGNRRRPDPAAVALAVAALDSAAELTAVISRALEAVPITELTTWWFDVLDVWPTGPHSGFVVRFDTDTDRGPDGAAFLADLTLRGLIGH